ncbi:MAG: hypothetical protein KF773_41395 [Deltaproteobacteria bacterium]|nr:hypothetical protein [Deltaproteobacteria bacterium]
MPPAPPVRPHDDAPPAPPAGIGLKSQNSPPERSTPGRPVSPALPFAPIMPFVPSTPAAPMPASITTSESSIITDVLIATANELSPRPIASVARTVTRSSFVGSAIASNVTVGDAPTISVFTAEFCFHRSSKPPNTDTPGDITIDSV